jgi:hypothetical protein
VGNILGKPKSKLKDFLDNSKKMIQPPRELPEIGEGRKPEQLSPPPAFPRSQAQQASPSHPPELRPQELSPPVPRKELKLPRIEHPSMRGTDGGIGSTGTQASHVSSQQVAYQQQPKPARRHDEDLRRFEEAINNINIDIIHSETPAEQPYCETGEDYYKPVQMGEGYFSEIEHYIRNKDVNEIIDDVLKKDFLTDMKDYHDSKALGKPFYLNKDDLKSKLRMRMDALRRLEEEWHAAKVMVEEEEKKRMRLEHEIDVQGQELKELFRQIKMSQWLEQEAPFGQYFRLVNGQELKSLNDLRKALSYMSDDEFNHHVNQERNDFATWVRDALKNHELYEKLISLKSRKELEELLKKPF